MKMSELKRMTKQRLREWRGRTMKMSELKRMTKKELIDLIVECDYNVNSFGITDHPWREEE